MGITSLTRSLPETLLDKYGSLDTMFEEEDADWAENTDVVGSESMAMASVLDTILRMFSSSLTMFHIDGRCSGLSWQQLRAKDMNFSIHSDGYEPILLSMIENIIPDSCAVFTSRTMFLPCDMGCILVKSSRSTTPRL